VPQGYIVPAIKYWAAVFLIGFVLGTLRVLFVAPSVGETAAVLAEMPFMLAASWAGARRIVNPARSRLPGASLSAPWLSHCSWARNWFLP